MAIFVDLDNDSAPSAPQDYHHLSSQLSTYFIPFESLPYTSHNTQRDDPPKSAASVEQTSLLASNRADDVNKGKFSEVIGTYPCIRSIVAHLDYTDLYNLSSVCKQFRVNLAENRRHLLAFTLRCKNEVAQVQGRISVISAISATVGGNSSGAAGTTLPLIPGYIPPAKIGPLAKCVKDLVSGCRICRMPTCRNCRTRSNDLSSIKIQLLCEACCTTPVSTLVEDKLLTLCACPATVQLWICSDCASRRVVPTTFVTRAGSGGAVFRDYKVQCGRGIDCYGDGWQKCEGWEWSLGPPGPSKKKYRWKTKGGRHLCGLCKGMVLEHEEDKQAYERALALDAGSS